MACIGNKGIEEEGEALSEELVRRGQPDNTEQSNLPPSERRNCTSVVSGRQMPHCGDVSKIDPPSPHRPSPGG